MAGVQSAGLIAFLLGPSGVGKTTAVYSVATHLSDRFESVLAVPHDIPLRDLADWLTGNMPSKQEKALLVLLDGREITDDSVGLKQLLSSLNQQLRKREDVIVLWPTTDPEWHGELRSIAERVGGDSLAPVNADVDVVGPPSSEWISALERLLIQLDLSLDDLALSEVLIDDLAKSSPNVGVFLRNVGAAVVERVDQVVLARQLPKVLFVVTSTSEVVGEANRLRRAGTFILGAREMLSYSSRSKAGKWWSARINQPEQHLAYIISLLTARLATMTPSSVVYACAEFGDPPLRELAEGEGIRKSSSNADRTFKNTDLYQFLAGETTAELTSTRKGKTAQSTLRAYEAIQRQSAGRHKAINQAICQLAGRNVDSFNSGLATFEYDAGDQNLYTDAVVPWGDGDLHMEFHHLSAAHCKAATISAYIMEKLQYYAIHHNLAPR